MRGGMSDLSDGPSDSALKPPPRALSGLLAVPVGLVLQLAFDGHGINTILLHLLNR